MRIVKDTPFEFGYLVWQVHPPQPSLMVVVKGTFAIVPDGECTIAPAQAPCGAEAHYDDDDAQSLRYDTDFALFKPRGECFLVGTCHPPGGSATVSAVSFRVGSVARSLAVLGDRYWTRNVLAGGLTEPEPFTSMPLRYELAFGGPGYEKNPVGTGLADVDTPAGPRRKLPNLEDPLELITSPSSRPSPAGAFPIPRTWHGRAGRTGTYDARWLATRWPWLAEDFDWGYFNAAPPEQQIEGYWTGDEEIGFQNLRPEQSVVRTRLPGLCARCFLYTRAEAGEDFREVPLQLDTITVDADAMQVHCLWRGLLNVASEKLVEVDRMFFLHEPVAARRSPEECWNRFCERIAELEREDEVDETEPAFPEGPTTLEVLEAHQEKLPGVDLAVVARAMDVRESSSDPEAALDALARARETGKDLGERFLAAVTEAEREVQALAGATMGAFDLREKLLGMLARAEPLEGEDFSGAALTDLDLSGAALGGVILRGAFLARARLDGAVLDGADLSTADLTGASFAGASLRAAVLSQVTAGATRFDDAVLDGAVADEGRFEGASFCRASLLGAEFTRCDLGRADFEAARMKDADLDGSALDGARFVGASLVDAWFNGVSAVGALFDDADVTKLRASAGARLSGASFKNAVARESRWREADLHGANFSFADLEGADFSGASLVQAVLSGCKLRNAKFLDAKLVAAELVKADVFEGNFEGADLGHADLRGSNLFGAELWRARTEHARLELCNLKRTKLA